MGKTKPSININKGDDPGARKTKKSNKNYNEEFDPGSG